MHPDRTPSSPLFWPPLSSGARWAFATYLSSGDPVDAMALSPVTACSDWSGAAAGGGRPTFVSVGAAHTVIRERYGRYGPANSALAVRVSLLWHVIYTVLRLRVLLLANGTPWFSAAALCIGIGGDGMRLFLPQKPFTYDLCLYTRVPRA